MRWSGINPSDAARRAFCGTCGARVLKEITGAGRWLISAGLVDGPTDKRIIKNLWERVKARLARPAGVADRPT